ncbi:ATP-binding protein [Pseudonocardia parietis]|uniref:Two-component sensor histidine kinase n=1 Tax=Pseudonocardia parietis TaxID=570936 RepID=A0ABS4W0H5_9PSEU|nr:ATP-binding protein [Pseudonocardia parietis]MBP2369690.1 two-component sensor histidine kinase [Pseudonocardia parietis]
MVHPDTATSLCLTQCDAAGLSGIRQWLRGHLTSPEHALDAELVATELISNAIDHGGGAHEVRIVVGPSDAVRVEVDDTAPAARLTVGRSRLGGARGNGLRIIDAMSSWGVRRTGTGKTVWAHL